MILTVENLLTQSLLPDAEVVAGKGGLQRTVLSASLLEVPDFVSENHAHELLFTTGFPFKDDPTVQARLIQDFSTYKIAGLVMKVHRFLPAVPALMRSLGDRLDVPILEVGPEVNLNQTVHKVIENIIAQSRGLLSELLLQIAEIDSASDEPESWRRIVATVAASTGIRILLVTRHGHRFPDLGLPVPRQLFSGRVPWRRIAKAGPAIRLLVDGEREHGLEQPVVDFPRSDEPMHLLLYRPGRLGPPLRSEDWNPLLVFLGVLAKRWLKRFWDQRQHAVTAFDEFRHQSNPTPLDSIGLDWATGCQWIVSSPQANPEGSWRRLEMARMYAGISGLALRGSQRVYLLRQTTSHPVPSELADALEPGSGFGAGPSFSRPEHALEALERTRNTLSLNRGAVGLVDCTRLGVESVLAQVDRAVQLAFIDSVLGPVLEYDRRHQGELLNTLATFLRTGTIKATAAELFLHYNTVSYRLMQVEQLLARSLDRHPDRLEIELAYAFMDRPQRG